MYINVRKQRFLIEAVKNKIKFGRRPQYLQAGRRPQNFQVDLKLFKPDQIHIMQCC